MVSPVATFAADQAIAPAGPIIGVVSAFPFPPIPRTMPRNPVLTVESDNTPTFVLNICWPLKIGVCGCNEAKAEAESSPTGLTSGKSLGC